MRYSKQELTPGWDQSKLTKTKIAIVGSNNLSSFLTADLLATGFGEVIKIGYDTLPFLNIEKINPEVHLTEINGRLINEAIAADYFSEPNFIVSASNSESERIICFNYARNNHIPLIGTSTSTKGFSFIDSSNKSLENFLFFDKQIRESQSDSVINSIIGSGIVSNEARKRIMPLQNEKTLDYMIFSNSERNIPSKILVVGIGAIGTFASIGLAMCRADLTLVDFDTVEITNLNRQILFYDSVGLRKTEAAVKKLSNITKKIRGFVEKVDFDYKLRDRYDAIIGCVDNSKARMALDYLSASNNIPLIDSGTSINSGKVMPRLNGKTGCLNCQNFNQLTKTYEQKHESSCYEPATIISNQIIGGLLVSKLTELSNNNFDSIKYDSSLGIRHYQTIPNCQNSCNSQFHPITATNLFFSK